MMEPNKSPVIASWDDLEGVTGAGTNVVLLPETSAAAGREIFVKVRAIKPLELVRILNFPMDEINQKIQQNASAEEFATAFAEHASLMTADDLLNVLDRRSASAWSSRTRSPGTFRNFRATG